MAKPTEIPVFVKGEPGFAAKLNQLADALRETRVAVGALTASIEEAKTKTAPVRRTAAKKTTAE